MLNLGLSSVKDFGGGNSPILYLFRRLQMAMTFKCNTNWFDSSATKFYEEGVEYDINLEYMAKLGTLKRFNGAEGAYKAKSEAMKPKTSKKAEKEPITSEITNSEKVNEAEA